MSLLRKPRGSRTDSALHRNREEQIADRLESVIRSKFGYVAEFPYAGHLRPDLTSADARFLPLLFVSRRVPPRHRARADRGHSARPPGRGENYRAASLKGANRNALALRVGNGMVEFLCRVTELAHRAIFRASPDAPESHSILLVRFLMKPLVLTLWLVDPEFPVHGAR